MIAYKAMKVNADGQPMSLMAGALPPQLCTIYPPGEWTSPPIGNVFINETEGDARSEGGALCEVWEIEVNADEVIWLNGVPIPRLDNTLEDYQAWWDGSHTYPWWIKLSGHYAEGPRWYRDHPTMTAKRIKPTRRVSGMAMPWLGECSE